MSTSRRHRSSTDDDSPLLALPASALALVAQFCGTHGGGLRTTCKRLTVVVDTAVRQLKATPRNGAALAVAAARFPSCCGLALEGWPSDLSNNSSGAAALQQLMVAASAHWPKLASLNIRSASGRPKKRAALDVTVEHLRTHRNLSELNFSCFDLDCIAGLAPLAPTLQSLTLGPLAKPAGAPAGAAAAAAPGAAAGPAAGAGAAGGEVAAGDAAAAAAAADAAAVNAAAAAAAAAAVAAAAAPPTGLAALQQLTRLTYLSMGLEKLGAAADVAALSRLTQLHSLSVRATLPEFEPLLLSLAPLTALRTLELHGRKRAMFLWRGEGIRTSLVKGLAGHNVLTQLHLRDLEVDTVSLQALAALPALSTLSLGMLHVERSCTATLTALTALTVVDCECVQRPFMVLFPALETFDCGAGGLWEAARDRMPVIQHHPSIRHLSICWPLDRVVWMTAFPDASWLATLRSLTSLHAHTANNTTAADVMEGVSLLTRLRALQINAPGFDDTCVNTLIEHVPRLNQLCIRGGGCTMTDVGLGSLTSLRCLGELEIAAAPGVTAAGVAAALGSRSLHTLRLGERLAGVAGQGGVLCGFCKSVLPKGDAPGAVRMVQFNRLGCTLAG